MSQNLNNIDTDFYSIEIPETESVIKEQTEWFKVDLPKKIIKHKKKTRLVKGKATNWSKIYQVEKTG